MNTDPGLPGIVASFALFFIVAWLGTCALLSLMGGWSRLASEFRARADARGESFRFASMSLGTGLFPARYRNALTVTVGPAGIGLSVNFLFRLLHPPLFIPWPAVESARAERSLFVSGTAVYLRGFDKRLFFRGRAGRKILEAFIARAA